MDEVNLQRKLGKQLLIVRMLRTENEKAKRTGISLITRTDIANWASMNADEIDNLIKTIHNFSKKRMAIGAAKAYEEACIIPQSTALFAFLRQTYSNLDADLLIGFNSDHLSEYCKNHSVDNYEKFPEMWKDEVGDILGNAGVFEIVIRNYLHYFVSTINSARVAGYDWDLISEMLWCDITRDDYDLIARSLFADQLTNPAGA